MLPAGGPGTNPPRIPRDNGTVFESHETSESFKPEAARNHFFNRQRKFTENEANKESGTRDKQQVLMALPESLDLVVPESSILS